MADDKSPFPGSSHAIASERNVSDKDSEQHEPPTTASPARAIKSHPDRIPDSYCYCTAIDINARVDVPANIFESTRCKVFDQELPHHVNRTCNAFDM